MDRALPRPRGGHDLVAHLPALNVTTKCLDNPYSLIAWHTWVGSGHPRKQVLEHPHLRSDAHGRVQGADLSLVGPRLRHVDVFKRRLARSCKHHGFCLHLFDLCRSILVCHCHACMTTWLIIGFSSHLATSIGSHSPLSRCNIASYEHAQVQNEGLGRG